MNEYIYLVTLCHGMDDIPCKLFTDSDEAIRYAEQLDWEPCDDIMQRLELHDCNTPCSVTLVTFRDGEPVSRVIVKEYDEE